MYFDQSNLFHNFFAGVISFSYISKFHEIRKILNLFIADNNIYRR